MTAADRATLGEIAQEIPGRSRVRATMPLDFLRDSITGGTYLSGSLQEPPLRVVRAFPLDDGTALSPLLNVAAGVIGGDQLSLKIKLGRAACVQLPTTGAARLN